ncbi:hypothetical protein BD779DRAFT_163677 [Infundibulicybe gibba]|nr:hypothetical protein BD779DRAFT_163677 [Infundibulicybe gibba]
MHWSAGIIEILIILACQNPHGPISQRLLSALIFSGGSPWRIAITPLSILGAVITLFGTALRIKCYQTLGSLFTFELCIQKNHRLVVEGPYSFVRHPSYTGLILTLVGAFCSHASGSWVAECGLIHTSMGRVLVSFWIIVALAVTVSLLLRVPKEDEILKQRFGDEWTKWAHRVSIGSSLVYISGGRNVFFSEVTSLAPLAFNLIANHLCGSMTLARHFGHRVNVLRSPISSKRISFRSINTAHRQLPHGGIMNAQTHIHSQFFGGVEWHLLVGPVEFDRIASAWPCEAAP